MISIFFKKRKPQFFITRLFYKKQTATELNLYQFSTIFRNCMKIVWQAFSHTLDVWNCMISIFGVRRSTRVSIIWNQFQIDSEFFLFSGDFFKKIKFQNISKHLKKFKAKFWSMGQWEICFGNFTSLKQILYFFEYFHLKSKHLSIAHGKKLKF